MAQRLPGAKPSASRAQPACRIAAAADMTQVLHHIRDTTMKEDAHRLRAGSSAQVMATLRSTAIAAIRLAGFTGTAQGRRWAARDAARPIAALGLTL